MWKNGKLYILEEQIKRGYYMKKGNINERLEKVDVEKGLGVWTSEDMKP